MISFFSDGEVQSERVVVRRVGSVQALEESEMVREETRVVRSRSVRLGPVLEGVLAVIGEVARSPGDGGGVGSLGGGGGAWEVVLSVSVPVEARVGVREGGSGGVGRIGSMMDEGGLVCDHEGGRVGVDVVERDAVLAFGERRLVEVGSDGRGCEESRLVEVGRRGGRGVGVRVERDLLFQRLVVVRVESEDRLGS